MAAAIGLFACGRTGLDPIDPVPSDAGAAMPEDGGTKSGARMPDASQPDEDGGPARPTFPLGVYDECTVATIVSMPSAGSLSGGGDYARDAATVTLTQAGSVITVTEAALPPDAMPSFTVFDGFALQFVATTNTSASLTPSDQSFPEFAGVVQGCDVTALSSGALTFNANTLYLSIVGQITNDAGGCQVTATFVCNKE
jgi:hypothetical protein